jgi:hypothetical protein
MLFYVTAEDHIRVMNEHGPAESESRGSTFASEQELQALASDWPMKRLVEIWNHLPGLEPVARFTDRTTAIRRMWRALQPQAEEPGKTARVESQRRHRPVFREGSKAAQVCTLLGRPEGATLNEIRNQTGWRLIRCADLSRAICRSHAGRCAHLSAMASVCIVALAHHLD